jgi:hypothetical protein
MGLYVERGQKGVGVKTDEQVRTDHDDAEMMKRPHLWPYVVLPLKRIRDGALETAVFVNPPLDDGEKWKIIADVTIYDGHEPGRPVEYDSAEAIVADGWKVD